MSNLSDLLPSGDRQNVVDFVASGTLASGQAVALNTDGTVSLMTPVETGTPAVYYGGNLSGTVSTYDPVNNKVVIAYRDTGNLNYGTAVVGTVSGTTISFGTPVVFASRGTNQISATFDSTNGKVVLAYRDLSPYPGSGTAIVGTVSGTSISFGTAVVFNNPNTTDLSATFDSLNNKVVIAYSDVDNSSYGTAIVGTVSGTAISFGTAVVFESANISDTSSTYDSTNNKVVISYTNYLNGGHGTAIVGTVSGTSISFGTSVKFNNPLGRCINSSTYDPVNNKVVIAYEDNGNSDFGTAVVGTVSGTTISFGTPVVFNSGDSIYLSATFDSLLNKVVIAYRDDGNSSYGTVVVGVVSGTDISFDTPVIFNDFNSDFLSITFDSTNNKVVVVYVDSGGKAVVFSTQPGLGTPAVFEFADASHHASAFDSVNNKVVIAYKDNGNLGYATAVVGTVSGTDITYGTPVVFAGLPWGQHEPASIVFDPVNNKVVIAYVNNQTGDGYAIVGTVSGTAISFGTPVVFEAVSTSYIAATYDSLNNKVAIAYTASAVGYVIVGTVSGTAISFGTRVALSSPAGVYNTGITFDSFNNKVVIVHRTASLSALAVVGTVAGTSISFGTPVVFNSASSYYISPVFDSLNNKVVIAYRDGGNSQYGTGVVGTVSGTTISFGTPVVFESATTFDISATFDSLLNKVVIAYRDDGNSSYGTAVVGVVSGTDISFDTPFVFESSSVSYTAATFDSTSNKVVIGYRDDGNSDYGTAVVFDLAPTNNTDFIGITAEPIADTITGKIDVFGGINSAQTGLTINSDYYVQRDGSLTTSSGAPAIKVGRAISATTINMKDLT